MRLGTIISIDNFGASDIINVLCDDGSKFSFPNVRNVIININDTDNIVIIDTDILDEIRV